MSREEALKALGEIEARQEEDAKRLCERARGFEGIFTLGFGPISDYRAGLKKLLGAAEARVLDAMRREHCTQQDSKRLFAAGNYGTETTSEAEWWFVTDPAAGLNVLGLQAWPTEKKIGEEAHRRKARPLSEFEPVRHKINTRLQTMGVDPLTMEEVIAIRLFSGPMYSKYQSVLRTLGASHRPGQEWRRADLEERTAGNTYTTTIHVLASGITRLSKLSRTGTVFQGLSGALPPDFFWQARGATEIGFSGTSEKRDVALQYAINNGRAKFGMLLEIEMGPLDAGANCKALAQYPHEQEIIFPPLIYHQLRSAAVAEEKGIPILIARTRARVPDTMLPPSLLTSEERTALESTLAQEAKHQGQEGGQTGEASSTGKAAGAAGSSSVSSKFAGHLDEMKTGQPNDAALGLQFLLKLPENTTLPLGQGTAAIQKEVVAYEDPDLLDNLHYILHEPASQKDYPNGTRDKGRKGERLADFVAHPIAKECHLTEPMIVALRLYTTSAFRHINNPLRRGDKHPLPVTTTFLVEGIKRLRKQNVDSFKGKDFSLWRGMRNLKVTDEFLQDRAGGTELAACSATSDIAVAAQYGASNNELLLKLKVHNFLQCGADLQWLSAFPHEKEILFPPLTYLQPTGRVEKSQLGASTYTIVEVVPHIA